MNINHLIYFQTVAQTKNFSSAAELCYTTQPNLSYGIKALEEELGVQLINRDNRRAELTEAAELYLPYVSAALQELQQGKSALENYELGRSHKTTIRIGGRRLNFFSSIIGKFLLEKDLHNFLFEAYDFSFHEAQERVIAGDIDIATGVWEQREDQPMLEYVPVKLPDMILVVDEQHPLAENESVSLWQIKDYNIIRKFGQGSMNQEIDMLFKKAGFAPNVVSIVATQIVVLTLVENRAGIALVSDTRDVDAFRVKKIRIDWPKQDFFYCICYKKGVPMSLGAQLACTHIINENGIHPKQSLSRLHENILLNSRNEKI